MIVKLFKTESLTEESVKTPLLAVPRKFSSYEKVESAMFSLLENTISKLEKYYNDVPDDLELSIFSENGIEVDDSDTIDKFFFDRNSIDSFFTFHEFVCKKMNIKVYFYQHSHENFVPYELSDDICRIGIDFYSVRNREFEKTTGFNCKNIQAVYSLIDDEKNLSFSFEIPKMEIRRTSYGLRFSVFSSPFKKISLSKKYKNTFQVQGVFKVEFCRKKKIRYISLESLDLFLVLEGGMKRVDCFSSKNLPYVQNAFDFSEKELMEIVLKNAS